jgi:hypothetical protein
MLKLGISVNVDCYKESINLSRLSNVDFRILIDELFEYKDSLERNNAKKKLMGNEIDNITDSLKKKIVEIAHLHNVEWGYYSAVNNSFVFIDTQVFYPNMDYVTGRKFKLADTDLLYYKTTDSSHYIMSVRGLLKKLKVTQKSDISAILKTDRNDLVVLVFDKDFGKSIFYRLCWFENEVELYKQIGDVDKEDIIQKLQVYEILYMPISVVNKYSNIEAVDDYLEEMRLYNEE